jgi:hypothetical protein
MEYAIDIEVFHLENSWIFTNVFILEDFQLQTDDFERFYKKSDWQMVNSLRIQIAEFI